MKTSKTAFALFLSSFVLVSSASAAWWSSEENTTGETTQGQQRGARGSRGDEGGQMRGGNGGMELPDGWEDMTDTEKQAYREENRPEEAGNERGGERMGQGSNQGTENGQGNERMELPDGWEDMTDTEKQAYREENRPEKEAGETNYGQQNSLQKRTRNFNRNAKKGQNYEKFTGNLEAEVEFTDEEEMENTDAIKFLQRRGIMDGYEDGSFGPNRSINRVETLKVLLEALGIDTEEVDESSFSDVKADAWYAKYVEKAKDFGFVSGYEDGTFKPAKTVNQAELLKLAFESFGIDLSSYEVTDLPDDLNEDAWYATYLQYALDNDLLDDEGVDLSEGMTRGQFSELVYRLIQQQEALTE